MPIIGRNNGSHFSGERPKGEVPALQCADLPNITVTGKLGGQVWGSNPYTVDSDWAVAAVHAGLCAVGETVEIQRHSPKDYSPYAGSTKNNITTSSLSTKKCGYIIKLAGTANPCGPYTDVTVTGRSSGGVVYGSNPYADGTDDAMAAVHAGLCAVGETVTLEKYNPGLLAPDNNSTKNGITSQTILSTNRCGYYIRKKEAPPPPNPPPSDKKKVFDYISNAPQTYTVPAGVTKIKAKIWGGGGGSGKITGAGGGGGYTYVEVPVTPGESLNIYVGRGGLPAGITYGTASGYIENESLPPLAFDPRDGESGAGTGGNGGWFYAYLSGGMNVQLATAGSSTPWKGYNSGAGGGGASAIYRPSVPEWIGVAGGGGGAGDKGSGGAGGGGNGQPGAASDIGGGGNPGTTTGPGRAGNGLYASVGLSDEPATDTSAYIKASHFVGGGGGYPLGGVLGGGGMGGGGYFGGGAGGPLAGGGGGSGFVKPGLVNNTSTGSGAAPGNASDSERGDKGQGAPAAGKAPFDKFFGLKGKNGRIIIWYD